MNRNGSATHPENKSTERERLRTNPARTAAQTDKLAYDAERHECVAVLVASFESLFVATHSAEIMAMMDNYFDRLDAIVEKHTPAAYRVETVTSAYVLAFGLTGHASKHAAAMRAVAVGAEMARVARAFATPFGGTLDIRVGVEVGQVVSGIVGGRGQRYRLFGKPMSTARRMEATGVPGQLHVTESVRRACQQGRPGLALAFRSADAPQDHHSGCGETFLLDPEQVLTPLPVLSFRRQQQLNDGGDDQHADQAGHPVGLSLVPGCKE